MTSVQIAETVEELQSYLGKARADNLTIGLVPTIGIPLPFLSYGGSSLMAFILLFSIYIKLDSQRTSKW